MDGKSLPDLRTPVPGPKSRELVDRLALRESPAITARRTRRAAALGVADTDPIVWDEAVGANVRDVDGNVYVDLTASFGVAAVGHRNPRVVAAAEAQLRRLPQAMGDAFPDPRRIELLEALAQRTGLDRAILGSSGSDAIEAAVKTARLATGRSRVVVFDGSYHGLSYGALALSQYHQSAFRRPFEPQLGPHAIVAPFGGELPPLDDVAAILVEPIQGRGGVRIPPDGWLKAVEDAAHRAGALFVVDEIFTGLGRTGSWFAFQALGLHPDLVCVGKALGGGLPISACVGTAAAMDAWGASTGEAIHTQTFLGHPVGAAAAIACLDEIDRLLPEVLTKGLWIQEACQAAQVPARGRGMLWGLSVPEPLRTSRRLLERGYIALPAGERDAVLQLSPPFTITEQQLQGFFEALAASA